jgi:hypothetical protein
MLDLALGGALRAKLDGDTTATTYRWHTRRLLGDSPLAYAGIQLVLGNLADRPITRWEESFLPMRLQAHLRELDVAGPGGEERPLVKDERQVVESAREPTRASAPSRIVVFTILGLVLAAAMVVSSLSALRGSVIGRIGFTGVAVGWSVLAGVGGSLILGAWLFTGHTFWGWNENLLQANPLSLVLAVAWVPLFWRSSAARWLPAAATGLAALSLLGLVLQALPGWDQVNGEIIALALPANLALAWSARRLAARPSSAGHPAGARFETS